MAANTYVAIMAGGIGSRFWPKSRTTYPKQFHDILNVGKTLIQLTFDRFLDVCPPENIFVITNEQYADIVQEQLVDLPAENILREPSRRNTAPCAIYVAQKIKSINPNANIVVAPSDHIILQEKEFTRIINKAVDFVDSNQALLTLGMKPTRPDTGYGYIQFNEADSETKGIHEVKTFTEKPTLEIAETFIKSGDFLWNSGMFVWNADTILKEFKKHLPEMYDAFKGYREAARNKTEKAFIENAYSLCVNISIDYGIMENAENVFVVPSDFGWSDVGTWKSLHSVYEKDYLGNAVSGEKVKIYDSANNMIMVPKNKLVIVQGLEGYCVVDTDDVLLISKLDKEQEVKNITTDIKRAKWDEYL